MSLQRQAGNRREAARPRPPLGLSPHGLARQPPRPLARLPAARVLCPSCRIAPPFYWCIILVAACKVRASGKEGCGQLAGDSRRPLRSRFMPVCPGPQAADRQQKIGPCCSVLPASTSSLQLHALPIGAPGGNSNCSTESELVVLCACTALRAGDAQKRQGCRHLLGCSTPHAVRDSNVETSTSSRPPRTE